VAKIDLKALLTQAFKLGASDVHLRAKLPPYFRINGKLVRTDLPMLEVSDIHAYVKEILPVDKKKDLPYIKNIDLAYSIPGVCRFRVNIFKQRGTFAIVMRAIPSEIPTIDKLNLPSVLKKIALYQRGLVLVTGATGSGKSTTLAAMLEELNNHDSRVVITIEDPIEYLHKDKKCIFYQREVGDDADDFFTALRAALREDPDVILVGEMRDPETVRTALDAAETGHMVFSTLHTLDAKETVNRIIGMFPSEEQNRIRLTLASILEGVISQRLVKTVDGKRAAAMEILARTPRIAELIKENRDSEIKDALEEGYSMYGTQSFDLALVNLVMEGRITEETALENASSPDDLALKIKNEKLRAAAENPDEVVEEEDDIIDLKMD